MDQIEGVLRYLLAHPIFLIPILAAVAMFVYGILKKVLRVAVIAAIAGGLYLLLVQYFGSGT